MVDTTACEEARDFVRYCYRRRPVAWPALYDEMCAVAARGSFRGMGYEDLTGIGISFALTELHRLAAIAELVADEERGRRPAVGTVLAAAST